ncbi:MAG: bifunctional N-acetylglucosamine-1-phosphate uridyltransferase/glucosamine-1-phosphate acetyltransferase, partial [Candidatus Eremiobacteraeota bacterium]|nr:bifunctional N-acetylglucosamine-1-phosphate uridyltransferase/glucosamine-1-phosphate acetyltransferase [Candidatus Eremiobacteraeota bacterium]
MSLNGESGPSSSSAIVLAAGKGVRMKSDTPKVLHEICGRPMIWWVLSALRGAGVREAIVVTSAENDAAAVAVAESLPGLEFDTVIQLEQLGTGHATQLALRQLKRREGTILVAYGDMPVVDAALFRAVIAACDTLTALALVTARMPLPSNFGRIVRDGEQVQRIVEAKDCTPEELAINEMNAGIYAFDETALRGVIDHLRADNAQGEFYLTDTIAMLAERGDRVVPVVCEDPRTVRGVNDRVELARARAAINERLCVEHMQAGVTIVDPASTYLEPELAIASDVVIYPNTSIGGASAIARGARLGPNSRIYGATVG